MTADTDPELSAMRVVLATLRPLSRDARRRVLWWINEVLTAERNAPKEANRAETA